MDVVSTGVQFEDTWWIPYYVIVIGDSGVWVAKSNDGSLFALAHETTGC